VLADAWSSQWMSESWPRLPVLGVDGTMKARNVSPGLRT
jgi:D-alanyl-D-alanine carboxypeptidase